MPYCRAHTVTDIRSIKYELPLSQKANRIASTAKIAKDRRNSMNREKRSYAERQMDSVISVHQW